MFYNTENLKDNEIYLSLRKTCDAQPEKAWLPAYYFDICLLDGTKIGVCDLRMVTIQIHTLAATSAILSTSRTEVIITR